MPVNLGKLSRDDLIKLGKDIDKALATLDSRQKVAARKAAEAAAKLHGFTLAEVLGHTKGSRSRAAAPSARYRHPENPTLTWSGRGRQPRWFKDHVAAGGDPAMLHAG